MIVFVKGGLDMAIAREQRVNRMTDEAFQEALARYNAAYDNRLYLRATEGMSTEDACRLQDEAMALCGSPYHKLTYRDRTDWEEIFLTEFYI
jgi:hypothetical protein